MWAKGSMLKDVGVVEVQDAFVGVFLEESFQDCLRGLSVFAEGVALADVVGAFLAGQGLGVEGDVADEVEGIQVLAQLGADHLEVEPFLRQLLDDRLLLLLGVPAP